MLADGADEDEQRAGTRPPGIDSGQASERSGIRTVRTMFYACRSIDSISASEKPK